MVTKRKLNLYLSELYTVGGAILMEDPNLRWGQCLMIALNELDPDMYMKITGTEYDPFYLNEKVEGFVEHLIKTGVK